MSDFFWAVFLLVGMFAYGWLTAYAWYRRKVSKLKLDFYVELSEEKHSAFVRGYDEGFADGRRAARRRHHGQYTDIFSPPWAKPEHSKHFVRK